MPVHGRYCSADLQNSGFEVGLGEPRGTRTQPVLGSLDWLYTVICLHLAVGRALRLFLDPVLLSLVPVLLNIGPVLLNIDQN